LVTARNLYVTIAANPNMSGLPVAGAWAMILIALLLFVAALLIAWDGFQAYQRFSRGEAPKAAPAPTGD
jgi:hypothetical protein